MLKIKEQTIAEIPCVESEEQISFASVLGKSEKALEEEFFIYQIQKLFLRVSKLVYGDGKLEDGASEENQNQDLKLYSVALTPYYLKEIPEKKKLGKDSRELLIDFPSGESSMLARLEEMKTAIKHKLKGVIVSLPNSEKYLSSNSVKGKLSKLVKKFKGERSFVIGDGATDESLRRVCRAIESVGGKVVINALGDSVDIAISKVNNLKSYIGEDKIKVMATISHADELPPLLATGVDAVYTPNVDGLIRSFEEKFGVKVVKA